MPLKTYYVYIMASESGRLYIGVTNNLERRVAEHKAGVNEGFTKKYHVKKLVYYDASTDIRAAIAYEKQIKGWLRKKKKDLIESVNPHWRDLSLEWSKE
jgi:putative endonuclease